VDCPRYWRTEVIRAAQMKRLLLAAQGARDKAYAPYSAFSVGGAVLTRSGHVFAGCNVENATFGATLCAERSAVAAMVTAGHRDPIACAVVSGAPEPVAPCGICRQVLAEFAPDMLLVLASVGERGGLTGKKTLSLGALFPDAFRLDPAGGDPPRSSGRRPR
jgi:cytidine deaminase